MRRITIGAVGYSVVFQHTIFCFIVDILISELLENSTKTALVAIWVKCLSSGAMNAPKTTNNEFEPVVGLPGMFPTNGCCTCVCVCVSVCNIVCAAIGERCANGRCVLPRERCDGVNDCGDYSDETNCSMFMCLTIYRWVLIRPM